MPDIKEKAKYGYLFIALTIIALGVSFILFKDTLKTLAIVIGSIISVSAVAFGISSLAGKGRGIGFAAKISLSVIMLICGIVTIVLHQNTVAVIVSVMSLLLIMDGTFKLNTVAMSKRYSVGGWWVLLVFAVILIAGAFYLLRYAPEGNDLNSTILAILLFVDGLNNLLSMFYVKKYQTNQKTELYYELFRHEMGSVDEKK